MIKEVKVLNFKYKKMIIMLLYFAFFYISVLKRFVTIFVSLYFT